MRTYDGNGNLRTLDNADSQITYTYDQSDNLTRESHGIGLETYTLSFDYDGNDALDVLTYPSGRTVTYTPDGFGRPTEAAPFLTSLIYHPSGQLEQIAYGNGQVTDIEIAPERLWVNGIRTYGMDDLIDRGYGYDRAGNVETIEDRLGANATRALTYDDINRLVGASGTDWLSVTFDYDVLGNIRAKRLSADAWTEYGYSSQRLSRINVMRSSSTVPVAFNQLGYDAEGNMLGADRYTLVGSQYVLTGQKRFDFDAAGHLRLGGVLGTGTEISFGYDGNGLRVSREADGASTRYVFSTDGQLRGEYTDSGPAYGKEHLYVGTQRLASVQQNRQPQADAGADQSVEAGAPVALDAGASSDPDGTLSAYAWVQSAGTTVELQNADQAQARFTAPNVASAAALEFVLTVTDNDGERASDSVSVAVTPTQSNTPPVAIAGPDQSVVAGAAVTLDGSDSYDPDGTLSTYAWVQSAGPTVELQNANQAQAQFTAPDAVAAETLEFVLTVTDNDGEGASDRVSVQVTPTQPNTPPVAIAGPDQSVVAGAAVTLDGSASSDAEGAITYAWQQTSGPTVAWQGATDTATVSFTTPTTGADYEVIIGLTVTDAGGLSASDQAIIQVHEPNNDSDGDGIPDASDNCPTVSNPGQEQTGFNLGRGFGDACVDPNVKIPASVDLGTGVTIAKGVKLGDRVRIGDHTRLEQGATIKDGATIGSDVSVGEKVTVKDGATVGDGSTLGAKATIGAGAQLGAQVSVGESATVKDGAVVGDGSSLGTKATISAGAQLGTQVSVGEKATVKEGASVGDGSTLGAKATIGAGAQLGAQVSVGESATVKAGARLGAQVSLGEKTVIGEDAVVGERCAIAANSTLKQQVVLGMDVIVGRNTQIKAAAQVGDRARIGDDVTVKAGVVVPADAVIPDGTVVK
ncbi:PKD domain-containing protein [Thiocystis violacea]|uniref:PKD domain-containing protein n=1 Tax=Thiocystis violacea TaxID=13725 RepID=UPI0019032FE2|nr:hypothetical protein [Thiocystis violacea]